MNHLEAIDIGIDNRRPHDEIVRKVFLGYPTMAFIGKEERQHNIVNEISNFFKVPYMNVQVVGSAKTGKSFHKNTDFKEGESDLDVAVIDTGLFIKFMEVVSNSSKGYSDRTKFPIKDGISRFDEYISYISKGIFRPDLMPSCRERAEWNKFFGRLSEKNSDLFKTINAGIYASQYFFESKQRSCIINYKNMRDVK